MLNYVIAFAALVAAVAACLLFILLNRMVTMLSKQAKKSKARDR
jgi:hypothetical protein